MGGGGGCRKEKYFFSAYFWLFAEILLCNAFSLCTCFVMPDNRVFIHTEPNSE